MSSISVKTPYYIVHGFWPKSDGIDFGKQAERASQEEQNGVNFSFIAPSTEELWVLKLANVRAW